MNELSADLTDSALQGSFLLTKLKNIHANQQLALIGTAVATRYVCG